MSLAKLIECINEVAGIYAQRANSSSGVENIVYGEICDAFRMLAEQLQENNNP